jgi:hypothetical protein
MTNLYVWTEPRHSVISYSDEHIEGFVNNGEVLFNEECGIAKEGWKDAFISFVLEHKNCNKLNAFVHRLLFHEKE